MADGTHRARSPGVSASGLAMSLSSPFIERPVATTLLTVALALAGAVAFKELPVAALPQVDFPTVSVGASLAELQASPK